jgi:hypothetical protein
MALGWFITDYVRKDKNGRPTRICRMNDFTATIFAEGGDWAEVEVLGGYAIVKVRASSAILTTIAGTAGFQRIPPAFTDLSTTMGSLTTTQRTAILNRILAMGYTNEEINTVLGTNLAGWRTKTLGQLLHFVTSRRRKPRYDAIASAIVLDGEIVACESVETVDETIIEV